MVAMNQWPRCFPRVDLSWRASLEGGGFTIGGLLRAGRHSSHDVPESALPWMRRAPKK